MICLMNQGLVYVSNLGLQRKVLMDLQSQGRAGLVEPGHLHRLCVISGLIEAAAAASEDSEHLDDGEMRSQLLTVALENHLVSLLTGCVLHWKDGGLYTEH